MTRRPIVARVVAAVSVIAAASAFWIAGCFAQDMKLANARAAQRGTLVPTRCGSIEYQEAGSGVPLLAVHGSGGA